LWSQGPCKQKHSWHAWALSKCKMLGFFKFNSDKLIVCPKCSHGCINSMKLSKISMSVIVVYVKNFAIRIEWNNMYNFWWSLSCNVRGIFWETEIIEMTTYSKEIESWFHYIFICERVSSAFDGMKENLKSWTENSNLLKEPSFKELPQILEPLSNSQEIMKSVHNSIRNEGGINRNSW